MVGLLLGPSAFNIFGLPYFEEVHTVGTLHELGELGVIFSVNSTPADYNAGLAVLVPVLAGRILVSSRHFHCWCRPGWDCPTLLKMTG